MRRRPRLGLEALEVRVTPATGPYLHPVDGPLVVNTAPGMTSPSVTLDGAGDAILAWQNSANPNTGPVLVQRFDPQGNPLDAAPINVIADGHITGLAADAAGNFAVGWYAHGAETVQFFSAAGTPHGSPITVYSSQTVGNVPRSGPVLAADSTGHFLVAWQDAAYDAFLQGYDASGNATGAAVQFATGNSQGYGNITSLAVTADGNGQFVVGWGTGTGAAGDPLSGVYVERFDAVGDPLAAPFTISTSGGLAVRLAADGAGDLVAVWSLNTPGAPGIAGQRFDDQGNLGGAPFTVDTAPLTVPVTANVAMDAGGNFEVAYGTGSVGQVNPVAQGELLYGERFDAAGTPVGPLARLSPLVGTDFNTALPTFGAGSATFFQTPPPALVGDAAGDVVAAWVRTNGTMGLQELDAQRFTGATANQPPEAAAPLDPQTAPARVTYELDLNTSFADPDGDPLTYSASQADGSSLPAWLHLAPDGLLWGSPDADAAGNSYLLRVTAAEPNGGSAGQTFTLTIGAEPTGRTGDEFTVGVASNTPISPVAATNGVGTTMVVWIDEADRSSSVMAQFYDRLHNPIGGPVRLGGTNAPWQNTPGLTVDHAGNFVVAWATYGGPAYPAGDIIFQQRFGPTGNPLGGPTGVPGTQIPGNDFTGDPHMTTDANGNLILTWVAGQFHPFQANTLLEGRNAWVMKLDSQGNALGAAVGLGAGTDWPDVAAAPDGTSLVVWTADGTIFAERFDAGGNPVGGPFALSTAAGYQDAPRVVFDAAGWYDVVWTGADEFGTGVFLRRLLGDGTPATDPVRVNTLALFDQGGYLNSPSFANNTWHAAPAIAADGRGNFVVLWHAGEPDSFGNDLPGTGPDGSGLGIFGQRFDAAGNPVGGEFRANTTTAGDQYSPTVAVDATGRFLVAWAGTLVDGTRGIAGQWYGVAPAPVVSGPAMQNSASTNLVTFSAANGNAIAVTDPAGHVAATALVQVFSGSVLAVNTAGLHSISGNGTNHLVLTGSISALNAALEGLLYQALSGAAADYFNVLVMTTGSSGLFGMPITVGATADVPPAVFAPELQSANAYGVTFATANGNAIRLADGDANGASETAYVQALSGTVAAVSAPGVTMVQITPQLVALGGTVAALNQALDGLKYTPATGATSDLLNVLLSDGTKNGSAGVWLTIMGSNNLPPTITAPASQAVAAGAALTFALGTGNGIQVADGDSAGGIETLYLQTLNGGTLALGDPTAPVSVLGNGTSAVALTGNVAALNRALDGFRYTPPAGVTSDWLSVLLDDNGNSGGIAQAVSAGVSIAIGG